MTNPLPFAHYNPDGSLIDDAKKVSELSVAQEVALQISSTTGSTVFNIPSAGNIVITTPGTTTTQYSESIAIISQPGAGTPGTYSNSGHIVDGILPPIRATLGAEILLYRYTEDFGVTWHIVGVQPGESIGTWAWADLRALDAVAYDGCTSKTTGVVLDYTGTGSARTVMMVARNGRWVPQQNQLTVRNILAALAGVNANTEVDVVSSVQIPFGLLKPGDLLIARLYGSKAAATGSGNVRYRIGNTALITETAVVASASFPLTVSHLSMGGETVMRLESNTSVLQVGNGLPFNLTATSTAPHATAVAIDDITVADTFFNLSAWPSVLNETLTITGFILSIEFNV